MSANFGSLESTRRVARVLKVEPATSLKLAIAPAQRVEQGNPPKMHDVARWMSVQWDGLNNCFVGSPHRSTEATIVTELDLLLERDDMLVNVAADSRIFDTSRPKACNVAGVQQVKTTVRATVTC